jgi:hypothetical protein
VVFKVTARTVLELGSELISSDIIAFYELIKNGFDAGTKDGVDIRFNIVIRRNAYLDLRRKALAPSSATTEIRALVLAALNVDASIELLDRAQATLQGASTGQQLADALDQIYAMSHIVVSDTGSGMSFDDLNNNFLVIGTASRRFSARRGSGACRPCASEMLSGSRQLEQVTLISKPSTSTGQTLPKSTRCWQI